MNRTFLLPVAVCLATVSGCAWLLDEPSIVEPIMSSIEARRALVLAEENLYSRSQADTGQAELLADSVIRMSRDERNILDAYNVKASAQQLSGNPGRACKTARTGIRRLLTVEQDRPSSQMMTTLRMLLITYVECSVAAQRSVPLERDLTTWHTELWLRFSRDLPEGPPAPGEGPAVVDDLFEPLKEMGRQLASSRDAASQAQEVMTEYVRAFNRKSRAGVLAVLDSESSVRKIVQARGATALASPSSDSIEFSSAIRLKITQTEQDLDRASARCSMIAISKLGWAREVHDVVFELRQHRKGGWRIHSILNHP
jgi:hypothetical protein